MAFMRVSLSARVGVSTTLFKRLNPLCLHKKGLHPAAVVFLVILLLRFFAILASGFVAFSIEVKCMLLDDEPAFLRNAFLPAFDLFVDEFLDASAIDAYEMVMMLAGFELENGFAGLEMVALKDTGFLELGQDTIDGRQPDIDVVAQQLPVNIVRAEVAYFGLFEEFENSKARQGRFETHALEFTGSAHGCLG